MFEYLPLVSVSVCLTFVLAIGTLFISDAHSLFNKDHSLSLIAFTTAFMLLRDVCIFLFFSFSKTPRRVATTTLFYLVIINGLLPLLAGII